MALTRGDEKVIRAVRVTVSEVVGNPGECAIWEICGGCGVAGCGAATTGGSDACGSAARGAGATDAAAGSASSGPSPVSSSASGVTVLLMYFA